MTSFFYYYRNMMTLGESKPWDETLQIMTDQSEIKTDSILKYFEPLNKWLQEVNKDTDIGWTNARINWLDVQSEQKSRHSEKRDGNRKAVVDDTERNFHSRYNILDLSNPPTTAQRSKPNRRDKQTTEDAPLLDLIRKFMGFEPDD